MIELNIAIKQEQSGDSVKFTATMTLPTMTFDQNTGKFNVWPIKLPAPTASE
jgi:hypothetical protein